MTRHQRTRPFARPWRLLLLACLIAAAATGTFASSSNNDHSQSCAIEFLQSRVRSLNMQDSCVLSGVQIGGAVLRSVRFAVADSHNPLASSGLPIHNAFQLCNSAAAFEDVLDVLNGTVAAGHCATSEFHAVYQAASHSMHRILTQSLDRVAAAPEAPIASCNSEDSVSLEDIQPTAGAIQYSNAVATLDLSKFQSTAKGQFQTVSAFRYLLARLASALSRVDHAYGDCIEMMDVNVQIDLDVSPLFPLQIGSMRSLCVALQAFAPSSVNASAEFVESEVNALHSREIQTEQAAYASFIISPRLPVSEQRRVFTLLHTLEASRVEMFNGLADVKRFWPRTFQDHACRIHAQNLTTVIRQDALGEFQFGLNIDIAAALGARFSSAVFSASSAYDACLTVSGLQGVARGLQSSFETPVSLLEVRSRRATPFVTDDNQCMCTDDASADGGQDLGDGGDNTGTDTSNTNDGGDNTGTDTGATDNGATDTGATDTGDGGNGGDDSGDGGGGGGGLPDLSGVTDRITDRLAGNGGQGGKDNKGGKGGSQKPSKNSNRQGNDDQKPSKQSKRNRDDSDEQQRPEKPSKRQRNDDQQQPDGQRQNKKNSKKNDQQQQQNEDRPNKKRKNQDQEQQQDTPNKSQKTNKGSKPKNNKGKKKSVGDKVLKGTQHFANAAGAGVNLVQNVANIGENVQNVKEGINDAKSIYESMKDNLKNDPLALARNLGSAVDVAKQLKANTIDPAKAIIQDGKEVWKEGKKGIKTFKDLAKTEGGLAKGLKKAFSVKELKQGMKLKDMAKNVKQEMAVVNKFKDAVKDGKGVLGKGKNVMNMLKNGAGAEKAAANVAGNMGKLGKFANVAGKVGKAAKFLKGAGGVLAAAGTVADVAGTLYENKDKIVDAVKNPGKALKGAVDWVKNPENLKKQFTGDGLANNIDRVADLALSLPFVPPQAKAVALVAKGGVYLYKNRKAIADGAKAAYNGAKKLAGAAVDKTKQLLGAAGDKAKETAKKLVNAGAAVMNKGKELVNKGKQLVGNAANAAKNAVGGAISGAKNLLGGAKNMLGGLFGGGKKPLAKAIDAAKTAANAAKAVKDKVGGAVNAVKDKVGGAVSGVKDKIGGMFGGLFGGKKKEEQKPASPAAPAKSGGGFFGGLLNKVKGAAGGLVSKLANKATDKANSVLGNLGAKAADAAKAGGIKGLLGKAAGGLIGKATSALNNAGGVGGLLNKAKDALKKGGVKGLVNGAKSALLGGAKGMIKDKLAQGKAALGAAKGAVNAAKGIGKKLGGLFGNKNKKGSKPAQKGGAKAPQKKGAAKKPPPKKNSPKKPPPKKTQPKKAPPKKAPPKKPPPKKAPPKKTAPKSKKRFRQMVPAMTAVSFLSTAEQSRRVSARGSFPGQFNDNGDCECPDQGGFLELQSDVDVPTPIRSECSSHLVSNFHNVVNTLAQIFASYDSAVAACNPPTGPNVPTNFEVRVPPNDEHAFSSVRLRDSLSLCIMTRAVDMQQRS